MNIIYNMKVAKPSLLFLGLFLAGMPWLSAQPNEVEGATGDIGVGRERADVFVIDESSLIYLPSRLRVALRGNDVRLDWYASQIDDNQQFVIYRHWLPIDAQTIADAERIATIDAQLGENRYYDTINSTGYWYYAIVTQRESQETSYFFQRRQNATAEAVYISERTLAQSRASVVKNIAVGSTESVVGLTFVADNPFRDLYILRSSQPIHDGDSVRTAERIARVAGDSDRYIDYPESGIDQYYAVVDAQLLESAVGRVQIEVGENATRFPVRATVSRRIQRDFPYGTGIALPRINSALIDSELFEDVEVLKSGRIDTPSQSPIDLLYPDTLEPTTSHERELRTILQGNLNEGQWNASLEDLQRLLNKRPNENIEARIRHYRGQALFYNGEYQQALFEFVQAQRLYNQESKSWISLVLNRLSN